MISSKIWFLLPIPFVGCLLHPKVAFHHGLNNILPCLCYVYHEEKTSPPVSDPPPPPTPGKSGSLISQKSSGKCFGVSCFKVITVARKKDVFLPRGMKKDVKCRGKKKTNSHYISANFFLRLYSSHCCQWVEIFTKQGDFETSFHLLIQRLTQVPLELETYSRGWWFSLPVTLAYLLHDSLTFPIGSTNTLWISSVADPEILLKHGPTMVFLTAVCIYSWITKIEILLQSKPNT